jgi:hypothetical protein
MPTDKTYLTLVFRDDQITDTVQCLFKSANWTAVSWSHAIHERDKYEELYEAEKSNADDYATELVLLKEKLKGPDGYETWQEAATAERIARVKLQQELCLEHVATIAVQDGIKIAQTISDVRHYPEGTLLYAKFKGRLPAKLSDRVRPGSEVPQWVYDEIVKLENQNGC